MNFADYFNALGLSKPTQPDLAFLHDYVARHIELFTFNNLGVLLHEPLPLDSSSLLAKVVQRGAGGYCFEHNKIACEALNYLGYSTRIVVGRVLNNYVRPVPRTHRITLVDIEDKTYLVDVGFGGNCPTAPIALNGQVAQQAGLDNYQIKALANNEYDLVLNKADGPFILYRFDLGQYSDADCAIGHFYSHKHPDAVFVNNLVVSKKTANETVVLINHCLTQRTQSQESISTIDSAQTLFKVLTQIFALSIEQEICQFLFDRYIAPKLIDNESPAGALSGR